MPQSLMIALGVLLAIVVALGVLTTVMGARGDDEGAKGNKGVDPSVYEGAGPLLTDAELAFYRVLVGVVQNPSVPGGEPQAAVMAKVRLADLVRVRKGLDRSAYRAAFNRIKAKHVDFVLCEPRALGPVCLIELDDSSHRRQGREARDKLVDAICAAAGLPILHVDCKRAYSMHELGGLIREAMTHSGESAA